MISLTKGPQPKILTEKASEWTQELLAAVQSGQDPTQTQLSRYRNSEIKEALKTETNHKCAYCESKITHVAYGDIEHIVPKSRRRELSFEWTNLTLACDVCNTNKGQNENLVDPYTDDPDQYFLFMGPMLTSRPGNEKSKLTEIILDLNRAQLFERRKDKVSELSRRLQELSQTNDIGLRDLLCAALIKEETAASNEYAAVAREFVRIAQREGYLPVSA